ncbi:putative MFS family arabinose efflux permease [Glaciihabitans tibetensis]|uniref:Putative MFS family arabinose efflux permease n=1 Tax=Glaciihabitans tibetensis TaxID=1266600 RepID=A0A2T0VDU2_9MICO|nr:MFS transporter [Glaciihabitans tibetensis]PRY68349.1 putative MFS family arabinose efflux permease [Glaciihabitans tibetensis]
MTTANRLLGPDPGNALAGRSSARNLAFGALVLSLFFAMASNTMVLTGMPQLIGDLGGSQTEYTWIVTTSLLLLTVTTPVWGRLADRISRKRLVQIAIVIYCIGTISAGLSQAPWMIIACRAIIGIGAGGIVTVVQLMVTDITTPEERPRYFGYLGAVMAAAAVAAPALGGMIVDVGGWRWIFFSTTPLAAIAFILISLLVRLPPPAPPEPAPFDLVGALLTLGTVLLAMFWITVIGPGTGWFAIPSVLVMLLIIALLIIGLRVERRAVRPLVPPTLLAPGPLLWVLIASVTVGVATFAASVYLAMYFQDGLNLSAGASGFLLVPMSVATLVGSLLAGRTISRTGRDKPVLLAGAVTVAVGLAPLALLNDLSDPLVASAAGLLVGAGVGMLSQQLVATGQRFLRPADLGVGSSLILFVRSLATVLALSVFGIVVSTALGNQAGPDGVREGTRAVFQICAALAVVGVGAVLVIPRASDRVAPASAVPGGPLDSGSVKDTAAP